MQRGASTHNVDQGLARRVKTYYDAKYCNKALSIAIAGSQAQGLQTSRSDIDLIVLVAKESPLAVHDGKYLCDIIDDLRLEMLILEEGSAANMIHQLQDPSFDFFIEHHRRMIERLLSAKPLAGLDAWSRIVSAVSLEDYALKLSREYIKVAVGHFDDVVGAITDDDDLLAIHCYRTLLQHSLEGLLCLYGDTYGKAKWISRRLKRIPALADQLLKGYVRFGIDCELGSQKATQNWLEEALRFHQRVHYMMHLARSTTKLKKVKPQSSFGPSYVTPAVAMVFFPKGQQWIVKTLDRSQALSPSASALLMCAHQPTTIDDLENMLKSWPYLKTSQMPSVDELQQQIDVLLANGLLIEKTSRC